jgi:hypothetical protein
MLERILKSSAVLLIGCLLLPGCGNLTKSGRQQIAYRRYVRKCSHMREHQRVRITKRQQRIPEHRPSEYQVNTGVVSSPQSVTSGESQGN